ncbi:MAG: UDP-N-acetylmuramoyl-tripeptide--D-alanyl-D-alanine ligase [Proteobacteria bacterium]|nr:UDP-N-acetylmuramoyl-tripeptide--D-alanyl-D-alanine ligase [Pseudomonadota bacterium]
MMMLSEASTVMKGHLNGSDGLFQSVEIDTRRLEKDALYFAIHGETKNGHEFIAQAMQQGAASAVADEAFSNADTTRHVRVDDTTTALGMLATYWRERFSVPVVGITGSNGKTTVCRILSGLFNEFIPGITPQGSFNNHWGVPLTLLKLRQQHQSAIIEMGMNHAGELSYLGKIVKPSIGLITNAAAAHLEGLKTIEGVARAKGELIDFVSDDGTVILNRDDSFFAEWKARAGAKDCLSFGEHQEADFRVLRARGNQLRLKIKGRAFDFECPLIGQHNRLNAAAAVAVAVVAEAPIEAIKTGLKSVNAVPGRLQPFQVSPELTLIDDSYNANKASMRAAIDVLAEQAGRKVLILGAMGELGRNSKRIHEEIGAYAKASGIDFMLTLVDLNDVDYLSDMAAYLTGFGAGGAAYSEVADLVARLELPSEPTTVLVKGSRFARMERVVDVIKQTGGSKC